jgi:hypothetical protein
MTAIIPNIREEISGKSIVSLVLVLSILTIMPACLGCSNGKKINSALLGRIQYSMSENAVRSLLGKPERVETKCYRTGETELARMLHYTLDDGRKWIIVISEKDELIGSGEKGSGSKEGKKTQKKSQAKNSYKKRS